MSWSRTMAALMTPSRRQVMECLLSPLHRLHCPSPHTVDGRQWTTSRRRASSHHSTNNSTSNSSSPCMAITPSWAAALPLVRCRDRRVLQVDSEQRLPRHTQPRQCQHPSCPLLGPPSSTRRRSVSLRPLSPLGATQRWRHDTRQPPVTSQRTAPVIAMVRCPNRRVLLQVGVLTVFSVIALCSMLAADVSIVSEDV